MRISFNPCKVAKSFGISDQVILFLLSGDVAVTNSERVRVVDGLIEIPSVQLSDAGSFSCEASNIIGTAQKTIILSLTGKQKEYCRLCWGATAVSSYWSPSHPEVGHRNGHKLVWIHRNHSENHLRYDIPRYLPWLSS